MEDLKKQTTELSNYIGKLLREHFGKGPEFVYVSIGGTFITCHLRNFISPSEKVLMQLGRENILLRTRDLVIDNLIPEIKAYIKIITGMDIHEFYYDWNLHNKSGLLAGIASNATMAELPVNEQYTGKGKIHNEVSNISNQAQKEPREIYSCSINHRTVILIRNGLLVSIEKQLIRQGLQEQLRIAKRSLEKSLLHHNNHFESIFGCKVNDIFVDWDFEMDKSLMVFFLHPTD